MHRRARNSHASRSLVIPRFLSPFAAAAVTLALAAASVVVGVAVAPVSPAAAAGSAPTVTLALDGVDGKDTILAGEDATYRVTVKNESGAAWYNLGVTLVVPVGVTVVPSSKLGDPTVYGPGSVVSNGSAGTGTTTVPAGQQLWVFEDVSDLPAGALYDADLTVHPAQKAPGTAIDADTAYFPVGSTLDLTLNAFANTDPTLKPVFEGSTGVRSAAALAATHGTSSGTNAVAHTDVVALHVYKDEPSPESELPRGVHDRSTVYTLTIKRSDQGVVEPVTVTDYLPAGLEFLGCGTVDNSTSPTVEYTGAPRLDASTPDITAHCLTPDKVETVQYTGSGSGWPAQIVADDAKGVYTKVTWTIPSMTAPTYTITYAAGIPLFKNVMWPAGSVPSETGTLAQVANLDNNTGASTRQSDDASGADLATDGDVYKNYSNAAGTYKGIVRAAGDRVTSDHDEEIVYSMDLRILKGVDTSPTDGAPSTDLDAVGSFRTGYLAKYTLDLLASEYTDASKISIWDEFPNGLCPILPNDPSITVENGSVSIPQLNGSTSTVTATTALPAECQLGVSTAASRGAWASPAVTGATVDRVAYVAATGKFYVHFVVPDVDAASAHHRIVYPVLMREDYEGSKGLTSSQDSLTNHVIVAATTTTTEDVFDRDTATRVQNVADDSAATITSDPATISKQVLPRSVTPSTGADPCAVTGYTDGPEGGFKLGDLVCYELTVNFAASVDTRNPVVTDVLPPGVDYVGSTSALTVGGTAVPGASFASSVSGDRITWRPYSKQKDGFDFAPRGSTLTIHLWGRVSTLSVDPDTLDKPQNLMKYQQQNVSGDVFFLRDAATINVVAGVELTKGVAKVDGATASGAGACVGTAPNCDHVKIVEGDVVTYRVDVAAPTYGVHDVKVWDVLPVGITSANVAVSGAYTVNDSPTTTLTGYDGPSGRSVVVWNPITIASGATTTLEYAVNMPAQIAAGKSYTNTASVVHYAVNNNDGTTSAYEPEGTPFHGLDNVPGDHTTDPSDVYLENATLDKSLVTTEINGAGASNTDAQITHGETATYDIKVTVPAHTTVHAGVLADDGKLSKSASMTSPQAYTPVSATVTYPADLTTSTAAFTFDSTTGRLQFPTDYDNTTNGAQTFTVRVTLYSTFGWANGNTLYNHATFKDGSTLVAQDTASVGYVQPVPHISKSVSSGATPVTVGQVLTYTLKPTSTTTKLYNGVVTDCVPSELVVDGGSFTASVGTGVIAGTPGACPNVDDTRIVWTVGDLAVGATPTLTYHATVAATAGGGGSYVNHASVVGDAYPTHAPADPARQLELSASTSATVSVQKATIAKTVTPSKAAIGDTVHYKVTVTLPKNVNFYSAKIVDPAPADLGTVTNVAITTNESGVGFTCAAPSGNITCTAGGTIASASADRVVVLEYDAKLVSTDPTVDRGDTRVDTATFAWKTAATGGVDVSIDDTATLTVVEPKVEVNKTVESHAADTAGTAVAVAPAQSFHYVIDVTDPVNLAAGISTAYDVTITDVVPKGVVASNITPAPATDVTVAGVRTLTWTFDLVDATHPGKIEYDGELAASSGLTAATALRNDATVTKFYSNGTDSNTDRRGYDNTSFPGDHTTDPAYVLPVFPHIDVTKAAPVTTGATVGDDFQWKVTFTNTGLAEASTLRATDTLPANWTYTGGMAATLNDGTVHNLVLGTDYTFDAATLTWDFADIPAGAVVTATYNAKPGLGAWTTPGVGTILTNPHTNEVTIDSVTDPSGGTGNATDTDFHGDPATASTFLVGTDIAIVKTLAPPVTGQYNAGDLLDFSLAVSNNGAQTANGVEVTDTLPTGVTFDHFGVLPSGWTCAPIVAGAVDCTVSSLAAGATATIHVFAQADAVTGVEHVDLTNTAHVTMATPEDPSKLTDNTSDVDFTVHAPSITVAKVGTLAPGATGVPGDTVSYLFTITNKLSGATLTGVTLSDTMFPGAGDITYGAWPSGTAGKLGPSESVTATATHVLTQADIDLANSLGGSLPNTVTTTGTPPVGPDVTDSDTANVPIPMTPSISIVKSGALAAGTAQAAGGTVDYTFTVTNTGNVTLSDVAVSDQLAGLSTITYGTWPSGTAGTLAPGDVVTATATYALTQADVDAGKVDNTATVTGTTPEGPTVDDTDTAEVTIAQNPSVVLLKTSALAPGGSLRAGDGIVYTFTATNTGNVSITSLQIVDTMPGLAQPRFTDWPGTVGVLAPGQSVTTTVTYKMTQADVDAGSVTNHAIVIAVPPTGPSITGGSTSTISIAPHPSIDLVKTGAFKPGATGVVGDGVTFTFVATNTGNVTLTDVVIADPKPGVSKLTYGTWPHASGVLAPGEKVTAHATYDITAKDVSAGTVTNSATVSAVGLVDGVSTQVESSSRVKIAVPTGLASTGLELGGPIGAMVVLIMLGTAFMIAGRRRHSRHAR